MNQNVYEQLRLGFSRKSLFMYLANEPSSNLSLDSTIKQAESKHNNAFVNKLVSTNILICVILYIIS